MRLRATLLGLVAMALFAAAVGATWILLRGGFEGGMPVNAVFSSPGVGQQLPIGGDVKVRGVLVGRIHDIRLEDGQPVVELRLDDGMDIPEDSSVEIRSKTVFGQKWVELLPGDPDADPLVAGSVIPDERTKEPLELERALQLGHDLLSAIPLEDLSTVLDTLAEGFQGSEGAARTAIDDGLKALRAVNSRSAEFDLGLRQLREFSEWLDDNDTELLSLMDSLDSANRTLVGAAPGFRSSLSSLPVFFEDLASFQEVTEDDLGRLVEQGATVAEIVAARADDLQGIVLELQPFTTVWNSGLKQPCAGLYASDMTCWQVLQMPGLDSRGLYRKGQAPDADEPGDPLFGAPNEAPTVFDDDASIASFDEQGLRRILMAPLTRAGTR